MDTITTQHPQDRLNNAIRLELEVLKMLSIPWNTYEKVAAALAITKWQVKLIHSKYVERVPIGGDEPVIFGSKRVAYYDDEMQYGSELPIYDYNEVKREGK